MHDTCENRHFEYMYVFVCVYVYTYMYICTHMCVYTCANTHARTYIHRQILALETVLMQSFYLGNFKIFWQKLMEVVRC